MRSLRVKFRVPTGHFSVIVVLLQAIKGNIVTYMFIELSFFESEHGKPPVHRPGAGAIRRATLRYRRIFFFRVLHIAKNKVFYEMIHFSLF